MKWTVTVVAETEPGHVTQHPLVQVEREDTITPASLGLSIAEGKTIVAAIQTAMGDGAGQTARRLAPTLPALCRPKDDEGVLHVDLSIRVVAHR
jgi:hypothetical protein